MRAPRFGRPCGGPAVVVAALLASACAAPASPPGATADGGDGGGHPLLGMVWDVEAERAIGPETLAERLDAADVAILGEIHDNPVHHLRQAWAIERIAPAGVAFEMVPEASERGIAVVREQGGAMSEVGPAIGWSQLGWPAWETYAPVFEAAGEAVVTGGAVPRGALVAAMQGGAGAAFGQGAARAGLDEPLPEAERAELTREMVASHCDRLPEAMAATMIEAQRLRDARFAEAALRARRQGGGQAVLVTGNGHARADRGVPVYLARLAPDLDVVALGQVEVRAGAEDAGAYDTPYDYVWFSEGVEGRPDPCAAFDRG
ncbi:MAG: ChaN family lipoprotein [Paracoccaceae bacterium]